MDHIYRYKLLISHVLSQQQGFPFLLAKKMQPVALGSGQQKIGSGSTLKLAAPGGSGSATLTRMKTVFEEEAKEH